MLSGNNNNQSLYDNIVSQTVTQQQQQQPTYTQLSSVSSPADIAAAYRDFVASSGGDAAANQRAAIDYLTNLGIAQDTIGTAYGLFKGA